MCSLTSLYLEVWLHTWLVDIWNWLYVEKVHPCSTLLTDVFFSLSAKIHIVTLSAYNYLFNGYSSASLLLKILFGWDDYLQYFNFICFCAVSTSTIRSFKVALLMIAYEQYCYRLCLMIPLISRFYGPFIMIPDK